MTAGRRSCSRFERRGRCEAVSRVALIRNRFTRFENYGLFRQGLSQVFKKLFGFFDFAQDLRVALQRRESGPRIAL
jgi:hypothetical protein